MSKTFIELKIFQVKPDRLEQFEAEVEGMSASQLRCEGCNPLSISKGFYNRWNRARRVTKRIY